MPALDSSDLLDTLIVTDLKNYAHCPRFAFYEYCIPAVRPRTFKMDEGDEAHERERERARRRTLRSYGLPAGERFFSVAVSCPKLKLRGEVDELVVTPTHDYIPVDYKLSKKVNESFALQITAYAMLLESMHAVTIETGYIYLIIPRQMHAISITPERRAQIQMMLDAIRVVIRTEQIPPPPKARAKCRDCEFRRFCNDV